MGAVLDKIVRPDMVSEGLRICYDGCNGSRTNNADPGNGSKSLARLVRPILRYDPLRDRSNKHLQGLKLYCQCDKAYASINGQAIIFFIGDDCRQLLKSLTPLRRRNAQLRQMGSQRIFVWVRCRSKRSRVQCCINWPCCSADLIRTKRIVGRGTASQIASASAASFLLRLT
jgi:hypothetical protein